MTDIKKAPSEREKKLAIALRQNLLKRKQQQRERIIVSGDEQKVKSLQIFESEKSE
ncbi:MAG: hypothetical protein Q8S21_02440 [Candidatus Paracaedibacteraceae bacterium]|nr:hypothetical protein [Candidatus Paracaedibacteraceae bacterium]